MAALLLVALALLLFPPALFQWRDPGTSCFTEVKGLRAPATASSEVSIAPAGLDCTVTRANGNSVSFFVGSEEWLSWVQAGLLAAALAIFGATLGATILRAHRESG